MSACTYSVSALREKFFCQCALCCQCFADFLLVPPVIAHQDVLVVDIRGVREHDIPEGLRKSPFFIVADAIAGEFAPFVEQLRAFAQSRLFRLRVVVAVGRKNPTASA